MKQYQDIAALAERLRIKRSTLYAWAEQGAILYLKLGRLLRFDPDEIEAWAPNPPAGCHSRANSAPAPARHRQRRCLHCGGKARGLYSVPRETRPRQGHTKGGHPWLCIGKDQSGGYD
jgi:excisionase family DNA binding protein